MYNLRKLLKKIWYRLFYHQILLEKLALYNFDFCSTSLLENYLSDRSFIVCIEGLESKIKTILCDVLQGSILGPLLFLIFINDLCSVEQKSKVCLFADDTTVYASPKSRDDVFRIIKDDLDGIMKFFINSNLWLFLW